MENPTLEISPIIHALTRGSPSQQQHTLERYFTPNASFTHPFCKTTSFPSHASYASTSTQANVSSWLASRNAILAIYQWYKILSPRIELAVESVAFDKANSVLYVGIRQQFRLWFVPAYVADVRLVTVLTLVSEYENDGDGDAGTRVRRYYISHQEDLYQTSEWIKFLVPWGIGAAVVGAWQIFATLLCVLGAIVLYPVTMFKEKRR